MKCLTLLMGGVAAVAAFGQEEPGSHRVEHTAKKPVTLLLASRIPEIPVPSESLRLRQLLETQPVKHDPKTNVSSVLDLQGCPIDDQLCEDIAKVHTPVKLSLVCTWITDDGLKPLSRLTTLKELDLRGTQISDDGVANLARITSLRMVDVRGTQMTKAGVDRLRTSRPELIILCATNGNDQK